MPAVAQYAAWQQPKDDLAPDSALTRTRLLVVDDHPAVRMCLREVLEDQPDFRVVDAVGTAEEALAVVGREGIDLAVVDYQLGGRSGLWVSRRLKDLPEPPRVVIYSAYSDGVLAAASVLAEADGLISKGTLGSELCDAIRSVAGGRVLLPMLSPQQAAMLRRWLDPEEQAIFAMRLAGIVPTEIAGRLGISEAGLALLLGEMLSKLEALDLAPTAFRSGRLTDEDRRLPSQPTAA